MSARNCQARLDAVAARLRGRWRGARLLTLLAPLLILVGARELDAPWFAAFILALGVPALLFRLWGPPGSQEDAATWLDERIGDVRWRSYLTSLQGPFRDRLERDLKAADPGGLPGRIPWRSVAVLVVALVVLEVVLDRSPGPDPAGVGDEHVGSGAVDGREDGPEDGLTDDIRGDSRVADSPVDDAAAGEPEAGVSVADRDDREELEQAGPLREEGGETSAGASVGGTGESLAGRTGVESDRAPGNRRVRLEGEGGVAANGSESGDGVGFRAAVLDPGREVELPDADAVDRRVTRTGDGEADGEEIIGVALPGAHASGRLDRQRAPLDLSPLASMRPRLSEVEREYLAELARRLNVDPDSVREGAGTGGSADRDGAGDRNPDGIEKKDSKENR